MEIEVLVPDIGDFESVDVIDVLVKPGDVVNAEDPLITLESDKATMDIPAPRAGRIGQISVKVGDKLAEGGRILLLELADAAPASAPAPAPPAVAAPPAAAAPAPIAQAPIAQVTPAPTAPAAPAGGGGPQAVRVPDLGDFPEVDVIEVLVKEGDVIDADTALVTLESDKATMEIPAGMTGRVTRVLVKLGDKVATGSPLVEVSGASIAAASAPTATPNPAPNPTPPSTPPAAPAPAEAPAPAAVSAQNGRIPAASGPGSLEAPPGSGRIHAGPAMRRLARELGVDLAQVSGSGRKGRIVREDVVAHVKKVMTTPPPAAPAASGRFMLPEQPVVDFARFGQIETRPLSKIRRMTGQNLHRAWVTAPHVTQFDEADITDLEAFRKAQGAAAEAAGTKLTLLAFLIKAVTVALARYPDFNASLSADGESLVYKQYFHIGMAANTPRGLVVPVLRDADRKGLLALAKEVRELGTKARDGKLTPAEMQGGCFTISSLGGVSGTAFTPIINVPEVAILGVSPAAMKPVWQSGAFVPRLMLPLSLSYDHRVIDGVAAAEFTRCLGEILGDIRQILL